MEIDGKTRLCGLIGAPVSHSLSPMLHNHAYRSLGLNYRYLAFHVEREHLGEAMRGIIALNLAGVNVTSPYKEAVLPLLDSVHPAAAAIGAVNTICRRDGLLCGFNTDGDGLVWSLREQLQWTPVPGAAAVFLGAGGAVRAAAYTLAAAGVTEMVFLNRTVERAEAVALMLKEHFPALAAAVQTLNPEALKHCAAKASLLVNGLSAEPWEWKEHMKLSPALLAYDLRYSPSRTPFMEWAGKSGAAVSGGLGMLVGQAALSFSLFTGAAAPFDLMQKRASGKG